MESLKKTYLQFIQYSNLFSWDVKSFFHEQGVFRKDIPLVFFGEFLGKIQTQKVQIKDSEEYKILGVRTYGKGVFINRVVKGNTLKMRTYQLADKDTLFWCKVDTKNGGFGIIQDEHIGGLGSSNMTFTKIDTSKIDKEFLQLLFTDTKVHNYLDQFITGTTNRKYIKPDQLLNEIKIPLPSLTEQNRIVESYNLKIQESLQSELRATEFEKQIERYLMEELGIEVEEKSEKKGGLKFVEFRELSRWDTDFFITENFKFTSKYPLLKYRDIFKTLRNGIAARNYSENGIRYLRVSDIKNNGLDNKDICRVNIFQDSDLLRRGTLLITRKGTVGNSYYTKEDLTMVASSEIFIIDLLDSINGDYVSELNLSLIVQSQYAEKVTGTIMPSLSQDRLKSLKIPLPPLEIQEKIVKHITEMKDEIKRLKQLAEELRESAKGEFEKEIFS